MFYLHIYKLYKLYNTLQTFKLDPTLLYFFSCFLLFFSSSSAIPSLPFLFTILALPVLINSSTTNLLKSDDTSFIGMLSGPPFLAMSLEPALALALPPVGPPVGPLATLGFFGTPPIMAIALSALILLLGICCISGSGFTTTW